MQGRTREGTGANRPEQDRAERLKSSHQVEARRNARLPLLPSLSSQNLPHPSSVQRRNSEGSASQTFVLLSAPGE
jgi:hypothetical protein